MESEDCGGEVYGNEEGVIQPEDVPLRLPSTLGKEACVSGRKEHLMDQEIALRKGQANDALAQIRACITYKYCLYKEDYRPKGNYTGRTRATAAIRTINETIQQQVAEYHLAFKALTSLGKGKDWKRIKKKHLKSNVNLEKGNQWGQSSDTLSWIWKAGLGQDIKDNDYLAEGK